LYFPTKYTRYGLHIYGRRTQLCMINKLEGVRRFRVCSLFHLQIVEFDATVTPCYRLYWHRPWFSNIPTQKNQEDSSQVSLQASSPCLTSLASSGFLRSPRDTNKMVSERLFFRIRQQKVTFSSGHNYLRKAVRVDIHTNLSTHLMSRNHPHGM
jgi:hypothetical protein